jgi:ZIP family zinc transporter/zinc and cadmium transporter
MNTNSFWLVLLFSLLAGLANLVGGAWIVRTKKISPLFLKYCLAFGSGFLLAAVFLKMIPISLEHLKIAPVIILLGYFLIHFFEHTVTPHFHFGEETHLEVVAIRRAIGFSAFVGLTVHALFDGVSIGSGFLVTPALGIIIFTAIILHKLPEGFTMASIILASGGTKKQALRSVIVLGGATVLGTLLAQALKPWFAYALSLSAGVSLYVAASDLIPEVNQEKGIRMSIMVFIGVGLFFLTESVLEALGL